MKAPRVNESPVNCLRSGPHCRGRGLSLLAMLAGGGYVLAACALVLLRSRNNPRTDTPVFR